MVLRGFGRGEAGEGGTWVVHIWPGTYAVNFTVPAMNVGISGDCEVYGVRLLLGVHHGSGSTLGVTLPWVVCH
jgi:hypothetical protein